MVGESSHSKRVSKDGFTIVELLIIIVVIAVLAAITIVAYTGISLRARQSALANDAHGAASIMGSDEVANGSYPSSIGAANGGRGIPASPGTSYSFHSTGSTYCITVTSSFNGVKSYYISNSNPTPTFGQCAEDLGVSTTTLAGNGTLGFANGSGTSALLASPAALVADASGNLYFSDGATSRIRKVTTTGVVSTLAGNGSSGYVEGTGTGATFNWPQALSIAANGNLIVADTNSQKIRILPPSTTTSAYFSGSTQGNAGVIGTAATAIRYNVPRGVLFHPQTGTIFVADSQNNRIVQLDTAGAIVNIIGQTSGGFTNGTGSAAQFNYPEGLSSDGLGNIYVADTQNHAIRKIDISGAVTTIAGNGSSGYVDAIGSSARFKSPGALVVATDGTIYVSDSGNNRIRKINTGGTVSTIAGDGTAGFADGNGLSAQFNNPTGIAVGSDGRLYVADTANHRIRVLSI